MSPTVTRKLSGVFVRFSCAAEIRNRSKKHKNKFKKIIETTHAGEVKKCKQVITEVKKLGGEIAGSTSSEFLSVWLNLVKAALLRDVIETILKSGKVYGESNTIDTLF
jgi:hypothetical protein